MDLYKKKKGKVPMQMQTKQFFSYVSTTFHSFVILPCAAPIVQPVTQVLLYCVGFFLIISVKLLDIIDRLQQ